jgi:hypothetical protein
MVILNFDFMQGQCFNFAFTLALKLDSSDKFSDLKLATIFGIRYGCDGMEEDVCIHCLVKAYDLRNGKSLYFDSNGIYADNHPDFVIKNWKDTEYELTQRYGEVYSVEYIYDQAGIAAYWDDLKITGAEINYSVIVTATKFLDTYCVDFVDLLSS